MQHERCVRHEIEVRVRKHGILDHAHETVSFTVDALSLFLVTIGMSGGFTISSATAFSFF